MILAHEQEDTESISFSPKVQMVQAKMNLYFDLPVYSLTLYKNTCTTYSHKH